MSSQLRGPEKTEVSVKTTAQCQVTGNFHTCLVLDVIPNVCKVHTWSDYLKNTPLKSGEMWITFEEELSKDGTTNLVKQFSK